MNLIGKNPETGGVETRCEGMKPARSQAGSNLSVRVRVSSGAKNWT